MRIKTSFLAIFLLIACERNFLNLKNKMEPKEMVILIEEDKLEEIKELTKEDRNKKDEEGYLLIHRAVLMNNVEAFKILFNEYIEENYIWEEIETLEGKNNIHEYVTRYGTKEMFDELDEEKYKIYIIKAAYEEGKKDILEDIYKYKEAKEIHKYAFEGNIELLKEEIEKGKIEEDKNGDRAIYYAISNNQQESLKILIEAKADLNVQNKDGWTAVMCAAKYDHKECLKMLIEAGADINIRDKNGLTAVMFAEAYDYKECLKMLIEAKADLDVQNKDGWTAVMLAAAYDHKECLKMLIEAKADLNLQNKDGWTAVMLAAAYVHNGVNALMFAASNGHKKCLQMLIEAGADINKTDKDGLTAVMHAVMNDHKECLQMLIEAKADINAINKYGWTAVMYAVSNDHKEFLQMLIEAKADLDVQNKNGWTAVIFAAKNGHKECLQMLIEAKADFHAVDEDGWTAVMYAVKYDYKECLKILIEAKADLNVQNKNGLTAVMYAVSNDHKEFLQMSIEAKVMCAAKYDHKECLKMLIEAKADLNLQNKDGLTAVMCAAKYDHKEFLQMLIEAKADLNLQNKDGLTAVMYAVSNGHKEFLQMLIEAKADLNVQNKNGWTAVMYAVSNGHKEFLQMLIEAKVDLHAVDKEGSNAVMLAASNGHKETVRVLLDNGAFHLDSVKNYIKNNWLPPNGYFEQPLLRGDVNESIDTDIMCILASTLSPAFLIENCATLPSLNANGYNGFHFAVLNPDISVLKELMLSDNDGSINESDSLGLSPIRLASSLRKEEHVKLLLSHGASPTYIDAKGIEQNPFSKVARYNNFIKKDMLLSLMREGNLFEALKSMQGYLCIKGDRLTITDSYRDIVDLSSKDEENKNVYHYLSICENEDEGEFLNKSFGMKSFDRRLLIKYDNKGLTPLHYALREDNAELIKNMGNKVLEVGISPRYLVSKTEDGRDFRRYMLDVNPSLETVREIRKHFFKLRDIDSIHEYMEDEEKEDKIGKLEEYIKFKKGNIRDKDKNGRRVVDVILENDEVKVLDWILNSKENGLSEEEIEELLVEGIKLGAVNCVKLLIPEDYELVSRVAEKIDIHEICKAGKLEVLDLVLELKGKSCLTEKDKNGDTPLHLAARDNRNKMVEKLLKEEEVLEYLNEENNIGNTAVHSAVLKYGIRVIELLSEKGCFVSKRNREGKRALDLVREIRTKDRREKFRRMGTMYVLMCAESGREYDAEYEKAIHLAYDLGEKEIVKELASEGYMNEKDEDGRTLVHKICETGDKEMLEEVMRRGASVTQMNKEGITAIELVENISLYKIIFDEVMRRGIKSDTLINRRYKEGNTLLHNAVNKKLGMEVIKYLIDNVGNVEERDENGFKVLDLPTLSKEDKEKLKEYKPNLKEKEVREQKYEEMKERAEKAAKDIEELKKVLNGEGEYDEYLLSGKKPIHLLVERDEIYLIKELIALGAKGGDKDIDERTAYRRAIVMNRYEMFKELLKGEDWEEAICDALRKDNKKKEYTELVLREMKREGKKGIEKINKLEDNAIIAGIEGRNREAIRILVELGVELKESLHYIIEKDEKGTNQEIEGCYEAIIEGLMKREYLAKEIELMLEKDREGKSFFDKACLNRNPTYLKGIMKVIKELKRKEEETSELIVKMNQEITSNLEELIRNRRTEHIRVLVKEYGNRMSNELLSNKEGEELFGKVIYIAGEEELVEIIEIMLASFVRHRTRKGIAYDRIRQGISLILKIADKGVKEGTGIPITPLKMLGNMVKPSKENLEQHRAIITIDKIYRRGKWATLIEIEEIRKNMIKYYEEAVEYLRELEEEECEKEMNKSPSKARKMLGKLGNKAKREMAGITNTKVTKAMMNKVRDKKEMADPEIEKERERKRNIIKTEYMGELRRYNSEHREYEQAIKGTKEEELNREIIEEVRGRYEVLIGKRMDLENILVRYSDI